MAASCVSIIEESCDLFVLSWALVRRVRLRSISSVLLMCGGGVCRSLLLPRENVCIWRMFFMSVVTVWGLWECCVTTVVEDSVVSSSSIDICCMFVLGM